MPALEKNILKYRTFQMVMILFYVEEIKRFTLGSVQVSDELTLDQEKRRLPQGTKELYKKLWKILVYEKVLSIEEKDDIEKIINHRNNIAHSIQDLVADLNIDTFSSRKLPIRWSINY